MIDPITGRAYPKAKRAWKPIAKAIEEHKQDAIDRASGKIFSLPTPWANLNNKTFNGLQLGWVITIGGLSGVGKTAFMVQLESGMCKLNKNVRFLTFTLEMTAKRLISRKVSKLLQCTVKDIETGVVTVPAWCYAEIAKEPVDYVELPSTVAKTELLINAYIAKYPNDTVVISLDHALLVKGESGDSERKVLIEIANLFNRLKKIFPKTLWLIYSQLNDSMLEDKRIENPIHHYPKMTDIFGGRALYHVSDLVIVLSRPEILKIKRYGPDKLPTKDMVYGHIIKGRDSGLSILLFMNELKFNTLRTLTAQEKVKLGF